MRCLRCALEYPASAQYCDRCGRTLSRPPGSTQAAPEVTEGREYDSRSMYSTSAPPAVRRSLEECKPLEQKRSAPPASRSLAVKSHPTPAPNTTERVQRTLPPSVYLARPTAGGKGRRAAATPSLDTSPTQGVEVEYTASPGGLDEAQAGETRRQENQPSRPPSVTEPFDTLWAGTPSVPAQPVANGQVFTKLSNESKPITGTPTASKLKPVTISDEVAAWRRPSPDSRALKPTIFIGVGVLVLLVLGGSVGYSRYAAYSEEMSSANGFAAAGNLDSAMKQYQSAINAWPLNSEAKNGLASAQATSTALTRRAAVLAGSDVTRHLMYKARRATRVQLAARLDATVAPGSQ
ncbi:MAG: hypothetical protein JWO42_3876 [Chloroflexi bacterium]|nr:hypothetical protein [Chloroflexota bacterium]